MNVVFPKFNLILSSIQYYPTSKVEGNISQLRLGNIVFSNAQLGNSVFY